MINFINKSKDMDNKKNLNLLSFKALTSKNEMAIDFDTATKNICIFGGTGTGKTTTVCYPALYKLVKNNCSGLILDIKGGYSSFARILSSKFKNRFEILGVYKHCEKINLIGGVSPYKLREFLTEIISNSLSSDNGSYWGSNGIEDFVLIYEILVETNSEISPTLADLYYLFNSTFDLDEIVKNAPSSLWEKIRFRKNTDRFSIFNKNDTDTAGEQRTWQFSSILKYLKPFYEDPYVREYFCNSGAVELQRKIYEENKIMVLDLPSSKYGNTSVFVSQILRAMFKDTVRNQTESWLQLNEYGKNKFTFLLIDEYQQFINKNSSPSMDDNNWFDTSRGYGNINIICTQSIDSLINKTDNYYTEQLIGNCRNIIHLPTNAKHSLENIETLSNREIAEKLKNQTQPSAYLYVGQNQKRVTISEEIILASSKDNSMNYFISDEYKKEVFKVLNFIDEYISGNRYRFPYSFEINRSESENIWEKCGFPEFLIDRKIHIVTSRSKSSGFLDFNYIINQESVFLENVVVYSVINKNELPLTFLSNLKLDKKDVLLFIRGGGDLKSSFLNLPDFQKELKKIKKKGVIIGVGYGHIDDNFQNLDCMEIKGITPTDLAYKLIKHFDKEKKTVETVLNEDDKKIKDDLDKLFS